MSMQMPNEKSEGREERWTLFHRPLPNVSRKATLDRVKGGGHHIEKESEEFRLRDQRGVMMKKHCG